MAKKTKKKSTAELLNSRCYYSAMLEYQALNDADHVEKCKKALREITEQAAKNKAANQKLRESWEARKVKREKSRKNLRKGIIVLAGLVVAVLLFFAFTQWIPNAIVKNRALEYYAAGAYDQALAEAEKYPAGDVKDSLVAEIRRAKAIGLAAEGKYTEAMAILSDSADYEDWVLIEEYNPIVCYQDGSEFMSKGMYEEAIQAFEDADGYGDSAEQIKEAKYLQAKALMADGNYDGACKYLAAIPGYKDAYSIIMGNERIKELYFSVGNYVTFGTYPQTSKGKDSTPIEWLVLDKQGNKALVISRYGLDAKPYNTELDDVTWETCTLRTWLNGKFLNTAFSAAEQEAILTTTVDNSKSQCNSSWSTSGGNTQDKVFLLSYAEAEKYFESNDARMCAPTDYAIKQGALTYDFFKTDGRATGWWWLRSPGYNQHCAAGVGTAGSFDSRYDVDNDGVVVRPALWLYFGNAMEYYESGIKLFAEGKYEEAIQAFENVNGYKDSSEMIQKAYYQIGIDFVSKGKYAEAIQVFEDADGYGDSAEMIQKAYYQIGIDFVSQGKYAEAIQAFESAGNYSDSAEQIKEAKYLQAKVLMADGNYDGACKYLAAIPGYKDVYSIIMGNERIKELYFSVGNYVTFGTYPQTSEGTDSTPIEWLVLDVQGNRALVISHYGLGTKPYNTDDVSVTWKTCTLRTWLNGEFLNTAFSVAEQDAILTATVDNS